MKQAISTIKHAILEGYDWLMRKLAKRVITQAKADTMGHVLGLALREFHTARKLDLHDIVTQIDEIGAGMERHFEDTDPDVAYKLGKQVAIEIIEARMRVS